jgi:hypothetical protein
VGLAAEGAAVGGDQRYGREGVSAPCWAGNWSENGHHLEAIERLAGEHAEAMEVPA